MIKASRYQQALTLLRESGLVLFQYYNVYPKTRTVKVYWYPQGETLQKVRRVHRQIVKLADSWDEGSGGGVIYRFQKERT